MGEQPISAADEPPVDGTVTARIVVQSSNPCDPSMDDIAFVVSDLSDALAAGGESLSGRFTVVPVADTVHGAGTTLWHTVYVWLPDIQDHKDALWALAATSGLSNLRAWRRRRRDERPRPGSVTILGPDGRVLKRVEVAADSDEPHDRPVTAEDLPRLQRLRPPDVDGSA